MTIVREADDPVGEAGCMPNPTTHTRFAVNGWTTGHSAGIS